MNLLCNANPKVSYRCQDEVYRLIDNDTDSIDFRNELLDVLGRDEIPIVYGALGSGKTYTTDTIADKIARDFGDDFAYNTTELWRCTNMESLSRSLDKMLKHKGVLVLDELISMPFLLEHDLDMSMNEKKNYISDVYRRIVGRKYPTIIVMAQNIFNPIEEGVYEYFREESEFADLTRVHKPNWSYGLVSKIVDCMVEHYELIVDEADFLRLNKVSFPVNLKEDLFDATLGLARVVSQFGEELMGHCFYGGGLKSFDDIRFTEYFTSSCFRKSDEEMYHPELYRQYYSNKNELLDFANGDFSGVNRDVIDFWINASVLKGDGNGEVSFTSERLKKYLKYVYRKD